MVWYDKLTTRLSGFDLSSQPLTLLSVSPRNANGTYNLDSRSRVDTVLLFQLINDRILRSLCSPMSRNEWLVEPREEEP
jgi:hypothetical protein